ncbi:MAG TPA: UbiA-like polyprenyltransferase [Chthonomonadales bacterium]|nr:UbiA-like polyprenyltransferase [Chthonomonadales bacterium]
MGAPRAALRAARVLLEMIKFEHTVFALPFAVAGAILAADHAGLPGSLPAARTAGWVLAAMVGARSAAMAFNRLVDEAYDRLNPRTACRALPMGVVSRRAVWFFTAASAALLLVSSWQLNPLCLALAPVALAAVFGYSYTKRFTSLSHLVLGAAIGVAPSAAWIAVTGGIAPTPVLLSLAVTFWIGGFDIIYALQDEAFDRRTGLHSIPARFGAARALLLSRMSHVACIAGLVAVGISAGLGAAYYAGVVVVAVLIAYEQSIVSPGDLRRVNTAFFAMNGWVSVLLLAAIVADRVVLR